jgi:hypothetical protein
LQYVLAIRTEMLNAFFSSSSNLPFAACLQFLEVQKKNATLAAQLGDKEAAYQATAAVASESTALSSSTTAALGRANQDVASLQVGVIEQMDGVNSSWGGLLLCFYNFLLFLCACLHRSSESQAQVAVLQKEVDTRVVQTKQFQDMKKMILKKNQQIKEVRAALEKYEPRSAHAPDDDSGSDWAEVESLFVQYFLLHLFNHKGGPNSLVYRIVEFVHLYNYLK